MNTNLIEKEAAEALLDIGVSLPFLKIPFTRKYVRVTMKRPCLGNLFRIAHLYLTTGVTYEQMGKFTKHEELEFIAKHGKTITRMVALAICRGRISGALFSGFMAWLMRCFMDDKYIYAAGLQFMQLLSVKSFMPIIKSAAVTNPMMPRKSQEAKGS